MVKKRISFGFMVFALLLYMLHASVPHHHHGDAICFNPHCITTCETCSHGHHHAGCTHHHSSDECQLYTSFIVTTDDERPQEKFINADNRTDNVADAVLYLLRAASFINAPPLTAVFDYFSIDYFLNYHRHFSVNGLRAPPTA